MAKRRAANRTVRCAQGATSPGSRSSEDAACACRMAAEQFADAEPPGDPVATPREICQRPEVATVDVPGWDITPRAAGVRLCGRDQEDDLGLGLIDAPGLELKRDGLRQQMGQRVSNLHR
jgi:hypothetical protein